MAKNTISNTQAMQKHTAALLQHTQALKQNSIAVAAHTAALAPSTAKQLVYTVLGLPFTVPEGTSLAKLHFDGPALGVAAAQNSGFRRQRRHGRNTSLQDHKADDRSCGCSLKVRWSMRSMKTAISAIGLIILLSTALAAEPLTPDEKKVLAKIKSDPEKKQQATLDLGGTSQNSTTAPTQKSAAKNQPSSPAQPASPAKQPDPITELLNKNRNKPPAEQQYSDCPGFNLLLRQDWKDLGNAAGNDCPPSVDGAQGAQISFANDQIAKNRIATIHGTVALIYNTITGDIPGQPYAVSYGAYTTVNQLSNSAVSKMKSNADTIAYGGLIDLGIVNPPGWPAGWANYLRVRGGAVEDNIKIRPRPMSYWSGCRLMVRTFTIQCMNHQDFP